MKNIVIAVFLFIASGCAQQIDVSGSRSAADTPTRSSPPRVSCLLSIRHQERLSPPVHSLHGKVWLEGRISLDGHRRSLQARSPEPQSETPQSRYVGCSWVR